MYRTSILRRGGQIANHALSPFVRHPNLLDVVVLTVLGGGSYIGYTSDAREFTVLGVLGALLYYRLRTVGSWLYNIQEDYTYRHRR